MRGRLLLLIVLVVSAGLRVELARRGGQFYWPDESRYAGVRLAAEALLEGELTLFADRMISTSDHVLFRFLALVPALLERAWTAPAVAPPWLGAVYFGLFGVGTILMVWLIVQRATGDEAAATWSASFYAGLASAFLFARHYFPYDAGLFLLLLGAWVGLGARSAGGCWRAGLFVGCGYLTYNAYWNVGAVILVALTFWQTASLRDVLRRGLALALGLVTPLAVVYGGAALLGYDLLDHARTFSHTVVQGDFGRGWWFILSYLTATEGWFGLWLLVLAVIGLVRAVRRDEWAQGIWFGLGLALAVQMVVLSDIIPRFAVAGRMVKPLMLFIAIAAGTTLARLLAGRARAWSVAAAGLTIVLAARSLAPALTLVFPEDFRRRAEALATQVRQQDPSATLQLYYAGFMHRPIFLGPLPAHDVVARARHPHQFAPYLFEGYTEDVRRQFRSHDFSMRLVRLRGEGNGSPARAWTPYAGVLQLDLMLPEPRPVGQVEPLLVTGESGRGDLVSLAYLDDQRVQLVADHWGWGEHRSEAFVASSREPHHVLISSGALLPPEHSMLQQHPVLQPLARQLIVEWDGRVVTRAEIPFFPATAERVFIGRNAIGGSTATASFTGEVRAHRWLDPREAAAAEWGLPFPSRSRGSWGRGTGPQQAVVQPDWSTWRTGETKLVVSVRRGFDRLELRATREAGGVRYSLWRAHSLWTDLERVAESAVQLAGPNLHVTLSSGLATPNPGEVPPDEALRANWLSQHAVVVVDGQVLFDTPVQHRGLDLAVTLAGEVPEPARWRWAGEPLPPDGPRAADGRWKLVRAGPISLDTFSPVAGLTAVQVGGEKRAVPADRVELSLRLPTGGARPPEPLLVTGRAGAADAIFVMYEADGRLRVGHDHWGAELTVSEPFLVPEMPEQQVVISLAENASAPAAGSRSGVVAVTWNGQRVLEVSDRPVYQAGPHELTVGLNLVGIGTCVGHFSGRILHAKVTTQGASEEP